MKCHLYSLKLIKIKNKQKQTLIKSKIHLFLILIIIITIHYLGIVVYSEIIKKKKKIIINYLEYQIQIKIIILIILNQKVYLEKIYLVIIKQKDKKMKTIHFQVFSMTIKTKIINQIYFLAVLYLEIQIFSLIHLTMKITKKKQMTKIYSLEQMQTQIKTMKKKLIQKKIQTNLNQVYFLELKQMII